MSGAYVKPSYSKWEFTPPEIPDERQFLLYKSYLSESKKNTLRPITLAKFLIDIGFHISVMAIILIIVGLLSLLNVKAPQFLLFGASVFFLMNLYYTLRTSLSYSWFVSDSRAFYNDLEEDIKDCDNYTDFIEVRNYRNTGKWSTSEDDPKEVSY